MNSNPQAEADFRECLTHFSRFALTDEIFAVDKKPGEICLGYNTNSKDAVAHLDLHVIGSICYILHINVEESARRKGYGRELVACVESFCRKRKYSTMITTPSGMGSVFWPAVGFSIGKVQAVKRLTCS